jgi:hypothetical protein
LARSLTKTTLAGKRYDQNDHRKEIDEALKQDEATLIRRSQVTESSSPEFMTSECLVSLIRDAIRREIPTTYNPLILILFGRCQAILESKIPTSFADYENRREKVMDAFIELVGRDCSDQSKGS